MGEAWEGIGNEIDEEVLTPAAAAVSSAIGLDDLIEEQLCSWFCFAQIE